MLYRWTKRTPASTTPPIKYGEVILWNDSRLNQSVKETMIKSGTLMEVSTPPLSELPDWEERAAILATAGIITISDLVAANEKTLSRRLKKTPNTIKNWKSEALQWLNPDPPTTNNG
jgi:hypothetical protein